MRASDNRERMAAISTPGSIRFGLQLPIQTLTRTLADPWEAQATVDDLVAIAQRCDQSGFDFIGVCDHVAIPDDAYSAHMTTTWYDTVATLAFLAAHTERVRLLSICWIAAYRHPLQTAKSFATLAHLSRGRALLGIGAGHVKGEFEALGIDFATRGARLDETLAALRGALTELYASHEGRFYRYARLGVAPKPPAEIPIWIGGRSRAAWRRAGQSADGWIPMGNPLSEYPQAIEAIRRAAEAAGRGDAHFDIGYMPGAAYLLGPPPAGLLPAPHAGGPEPLAAEIRRAREAGANIFHLKFRARELREYLDQLDAFGEQLTPLVVSR
jgi:probable F420-dependent oxidoreductase